MELTFQDGKVIQYDVSILFDKYPSLLELKNRKLFKSGKLTGYGIIWNDDLDIETETIYEEGTVIDNIKPAENIVIGNVVLKARADKNWSQKELSDASGIDQSDISKIERGVANPSVSTLKRLAEAMGKELKIEII